MTPDEPRLRTRRIRIAEIPIKGGVVKGELTVPADAAGLVVFAPETPEDAASMRDMTRIFDKYHLATLLPEIAMTASPPPMDALGQSELLEQVTAWAGQNPDTAALRAGYFAIGAAAAGALIAAARLPNAVRAVVARSGKIDGVQEFFPMVRAPVLLIVGGRDVQGTAGSRAALTTLNVPSTLNVVSAASRLFHEIGTQEESAQLAALWFTRYLE